MEGGITEQDRSTLLRAAIARVEREQMRQALARTVDLTAQAPKVAVNALNALRKHHDPVSVVDRAQYRVALPWVAAVIADDCLNRTIEVLGDHSDDPTAEQLRSALDEVGASFSDVTIAVMLASVADSDMPSSDLCFELAVTDERYGLTEWAAFDRRTDRPTAAPPSRQPTPEQREARRLKKQQEAEERKKRQEAARRAGEQARQARKKPRSSTGSSAAAVATGEPALLGVPTEVIRRPVLTPLQRDEFDPGDPWVSAVVFAWVAFRGDEADRQELDGKSRRCVVVAGSPTQLLVRPGYSEGGMAGRSWKSVPLRHWRKAGFDQPTSIDGEAVAVPRDPEVTPVGWLDPEDWNALW
jgi:hypothetical protein